MSEVALSEAEIQVLASLYKAEAEEADTGKSALEEGGTRYWWFQEDWTDAFPRLLAKGLIDGDEQSYHLTRSGRPVAARYHAERPDMYWYYYQKFYPAARASAAHSRLCERVFGMDLTQEGMTDMPALHHLLQLLDIKADDHVLDLGCGAGGIAEYVSDKLSAHVTGVDYAAPAIAEARERTEDRRSRLEFVNGDMNCLELPEQSFKVVISLDTLYWVADLKDTMRQIEKLLKPGGQMGIFMLSDVPNGRTADDYSASETSLGRCLGKLGLAFDAHDYTLQNSAFWYRNYEAAKSLRDEFEKEGNGFIAASLIREGEEDFLPSIEAGTLVRYLYHVRL
ncbi:MAG TPA: class I SAM-dependent methyltransferase [Gammaproteobacteria bacterium]|nr:class I SAM-dependent methyltransferase [Gammaproteobacteria bacterium]